MKVPFDLMAELLQGEMKDFFSCLLLQEMLNTLQLSGIRDSQMLSLHAVASVASETAHCVPAVFPGRFSL